MTTGSGTVAAAPVTDVRVVCSSSITVDIRPTLPVAWSFDVDRTAYDVECGLGCQTARFIVTAPDASARRVNGVPVPDATPSQPIELASGDTQVVVDIQVGGLSQQYTVVIRREQLVVSPVAFGKSSNSETGDEFGTAVAADGNVLVVGAPGEDSNASMVNQDQTNNAAPESGAAYVFRRAPGTLTWTQEAYLKGSTGTGLSPADLFGTSVAVRGDVIVVGAPGDNFYVPGGGAAHVFRRSGGSWTYETTLRPSQATSGAGFGSTVAITETDGVLQIAVGAPLDGDGGLPASGSVSTYRRASGAWQMVEELHAMNPDGDDRFGAALAMCGDLLAVGAIFEEGDGTGVNPPPNNNIDDAGAVYLYRRTETGWMHEAYVKSSQPDEERFGTGVSCDEDLLAVGAANATDGAFVGVGAAYVFRRTDGAWAQEQRLLRPPSRSTVPTSGRSSPLAEISC